MTEQTPSILIVDDEEMVLSSLRGVFTLQTDYDVHEALTPHEALERVETSRIDVIISDFLMPEMNGIELLKQVKQVQPEAVRLLLTGYADKENAIRAINDVGLYHYLEKPWDNDALLNIVRNAIEEKSLRRKLSDKVKELDHVLSRHGELEEKHRYLEEELEMAANIQKSLLPTSFPEVDSYRFANLYRPTDALGGDFFDMIPKNDRAVLMVSDVIGHGVQAALSTMLLKGVFRDAAAGIDSPIGLLDEMNRRLHAVLPTGMYAAAAVFFFQHGASEIAYANAGLPYPFVLRADKSLDEYVIGGPPLGMLEPGLMPYECRTIEVNVGDVMVAGSDGLGSIMSSDGAMFDDDELRRSLKELAGNDGEYVLEQIFERGVAFGGGKPLPDDVNFVAATRIAD